jgi:hypothetical protein
MDSRGKAETINEQVGVVMDSPPYVEDWTAANVEAALSPFYSRWDSGKYAALLRGFGVDTKKKVKELSRGMTVKPYCTWKTMLIIITVAIILSLNSDSGTLTVGMMMMYAGMMVAYPFAVGEKSGLDGLSGPSRWATCSEKTKHPAG